MSVYSGFATRLQETTYFTLVERIVKLLSKKCLSSILECKRPKPEIFRPDQRRALGVQLETDILRDPCDRQAQICPAALLRDSCSLCLPRVPALCISILLTHSRASSNRSTTKVGLLGAASRELSRMTHLLSNAT